MKVLIYKISKVFTSGYKKGLYFSSELTFPNHTSAMKWKAGIKRNISKGLLDFDLIECRLVGSKVI